MCIGTSPDARPGLLEGLIGIATGAVVARLLEPYWFAYISSVSGGSFWSNWAPVVTGPTSPVAGFIGYRLLAVAALLGGGCALAGLLIWAKAQFPHLGWPLSRLATEGELPGNAIAAAWVVYMTTVVVGMSLLGLRRWKRLPP